MFRVTDMGIFTEMLRQCKDDLSPDTQLSVSVHLTRRENWTVLWIWNLNLSFGRSLQVVFYNDLLVQSLILVKTQNPNKYVPLVFPAMSRCYYKSGRFLNWHATWLKGNKRHLQCPDWFGVGGPHHLVFLSFLQNLRNYKDLRFCSEQIFYWLCQKVWRTSKNIAKMLTWNFWPYL